MSSPLARFAVLTLISLGAAGCMPVASNQGFQMVDVAPSDIQAGVDTKDTVNEKLGTPSTKTTLGDDTWYYVTQVSSRVAFYQPRVTTRSVVAIAFNPSDGKVASVKKYGIEDGKVFAYNSRSTPTLGRELSVVEQLIGNLGNAAPFLGDNQQGIPGSRPGD